MPVKSAADRDEGSGKWWVAIPIVIIVLALVAVAAVVWQRQIVAMMPGAAAVYEAVGLPTQAPGDGLLIPMERVTQTEVTVDGRVDLIIAGVVRNISDQVREVPRIRWTLVDSEEQPLQSVVVGASGVRLAPGEELSVEARIEGRSDDGRQIKAYWEPAE